VTDSTVLGYKGKSGAVPQKVLVYCLFWVSPDFFPHTKKLVQTAFVWVKTLVTLYGCRPAYGTPRVLWTERPRDAAGVWIPGRLLIAEMMVQSPGGIFCELEPPFSGSAVVYERGIE